jgi:hypothetical protein
VLRAAGEAETTKENIQDWLQLDEGDPGFQVLTEEEIAAVTFLFIFISTTYIIKISIYMFCTFLLSFRAVFFVINPDNLSSPELMWISECLLYSGRTVNVLWVLKRTTKNLSPNGRCPLRESNRTPPSRSVECYHHVNSLGIHYTSTVKLAL